MMENFKIIIKTHGEEGFLPICKDGTTYYGGYQGWLKDEGIKEFYSNRSCSVTAASNFFLHMIYCKDHKEMEKIDYKIFNFYQKEIYRYIRPRPSGIISIGILDRSFSKYVKEKGLNFKKVVFKGEFSRANVLNYIKSALEKNLPVLLLTWGSELKELSYHWITIIGLYSSDGHIVMVSSNWGELREYDFNRWFDSFSLYKGLIYWDENKKYNEN